MAFFKKKKKGKGKATYPDNDYRDRIDELNGMSGDDFAEYIGKIADGGDPEPVPEETDEHDEPEEIDGHEQSEEPEDAEEPEEMSTPEKKESKPYRSFATESEYRADVNKAIAAARKSWDLDNAAVMKRYRRMERIAKGFFDGDDAFDKLGDELDKQQAENANMSPEDYRKLVAYDEMRYNEDKRNSIVDKWTTDAGNLMVIVPDFSLQDALQNEVFKSALLSGDDVFAAYAKAYKGDPDPEPEPEDLPEDESEDEPEETPKRRSIPQNGQGKRKGTGGGYSDPSKLSTKDFKEYIDKIRNS